MGKGTILELDLRTEGQSNSLNYLVSLIVDVSLMLLLLALSKP